MTHPSSHIAQSSLERARSPSDALWALKSFDAQAAEPVKEKGSPEVGKNEEDGGKEKLDTFYDDPSADVVLVSKDGVIFRYYSHVLKKTR